jgi:HAD superfamily hydrolase (TIGR01509 family)
MNAVEFSGIAFDLDGVLVNSTPVHVWAFREVLRPLGITQFDYARWAGMTTRETIQRVLAENRIESNDAERIELTAMKTALAREKLRKAPAIMDGCTPLLERLSRQLPLALASSASPDSIELFLDYSRCRPFFSVVLSGSNVERSKPEPDIYELAARLLGLSPDRMLVVEDAVSGVQAGRSAGCEVWGVLGTCRADALRSAGASRVFDSLTDVGRGILDESH